MEVTQSTVSDNMLAALNDRSRFSTKECPRDSRQLNIYLTLRAIIGQARIIVVPVRSYLLLLNFSDEP